MIGAAMAGVGAVASIAGGLIGGKKAKKAAKKQKILAQEIGKESAIQAQAANEQFDIENEMQRVQQARANIQAKRDKLEMIREARVRRGMILGGAAASGVGAGTSTTAGAVGSIVSQFGANTGMFNIANQAATALSSLGEAAAGKQRTQLASQGRVNVLQGQGQVAQAKAQQGMAFGNMLSNAGQSLFQISQQEFGGFFPKKISSAT